MLSFAVRYQGEYAYGPLPSKSELTSIDNRDAKLGEGGVAMYERKERDTKMYMYVQLSILYYLYDKFNITFLNPMPIPYQENLNAIQD